MLKNFNIKLNNVGCIDKANLNIGKINILGGKNSTGKSTSSKILYAFLRSNSKSRKKIAHKTLIDEIIGLNLDLISFSRIAWDDKEESKLIRSEAINIMESMKKSDIDKKLIINTKNIKILDIYEKVKKNYENHSNNAKEGHKKIIDEEFNKIEKLIKIYENDDEELFKSVFQQIIRFEFGKSNDLNNAIFTGKFNETDFRYEINFNDAEFNIKQSSILIEDVYYMDSFSFFDIISRNGSDTTEHSNHFIKSLINDDESSKWADEIINKNLIDLEKIIKKITKGNFDIENNNIIYNHNDGNEYFMKNTASGIKQIGIIQMLLSKRKLKENTFLIIDEPEINMHPEWQVKFAEVLILLSKCLNVTLYINSHSPFFIEALSLYSKYHGLLNETNFYLTEESSKEGYYNINQVPINNLNSIYDNLGKAIDMIDDLKLKLEFERTDD